MKGWFIKNSRVLKTIGIIIIILALPITLVLLKESQDQRSSAAEADKLETEGGVLSSTGATKVSDSGASGGQYVTLSNQTSTPAPSSAPSQSSWGPRPALSTPTGSNVYTVPSSIDGTGTTNVSSTLLSFINSVPNSSIIVFPAGKTYQINPGISLSNRNNLTFWGYGATLRPLGPGSDSASSAFRFFNSDNMKILGFTIRGSHTDMNTLGDGESLMGVYLRDDSDNVEVADNRIFDVHADGIFVYVFGLPACDNWNFHHNLIENTGRMGITINEGSGKIEYNIIRGPGMYSIDAEDQNPSNPKNGGNKNLGPVVINNNWFDGWEQYDRYSTHAVVSDYGIENFETIHDFTIENNLFTAGDMGTRSIEYDDTDGMISFWGNTPKTNMIIRNNTFNLPSDQRSGWAIRLNYVTGGQITGNVIPGQTVQCSNCSNVTIQNNQ